MDRREELSLRLPPAVAADLRSLADASEHTIEALALMAIERFVEDEKVIVDQINAGLADIAAGQTFSHDDVMAEMREIIERAAAHRRAASA